MKNQIIQGDCLTKLKTLDENSVDSIVTDPPYELGFMGKSWDNTGIANNKEMWAECLRVLKPGGYLLSFGGTRTYHRMAVAIEDAGFEVRDMIEWVYGSGFPKSLNIGKAVDKLQGNEREVSRVRTDGSGNATSENNMYDADHKFVATKVFNETKGTSEWEGWGTALKPAHEPICMARKPLAEKTVAENCLKYGTGGINIDISRVSTYAYKDGGSNESIVPSHKLSELRGKLYTLLSSCVADKTDFPPFPNDGEYALRWKELSDFLCGCQFCRDLYDGLLPLFQEGDQVSFQQLHDVQDDIFRLHKEPSNNHGVCIFRPSTEDVLSQLKSYSNDTKLDIQSQGRFPANLLHDNSEEVRKCFPESKSGNSKSNKYDTDNPSLYNGGWGYQRNEDYGDVGSASRFFKSINISGVGEIEDTTVGEDYRASQKAGTPQRLEATDGASPSLPTNFKSIIYQAKASKKDRGVGNNHPTVKSVALMEYLIKMVTPKGGIVLDPFAGSGSTLVAAKQNGYKYIGIELTPEYIDIINARLK